MKRWVAGATLWLAGSAAIAVPGAAFAELQLQDFEAGIFSKKSIAGLVLEPGERLVGNDEAVEETRAIPAELGVKFGIKYSVSGKSIRSNRVTYLYLTPGVKNPDGSRNDKYEFEKELSPSSRFHTIAYEFTDPHEIVKGIWRIMVFDGDRLLVAESFAVGVDESLLSQPAMEKPATFKSLIKPVKAAAESDFAE